MRNIFILLAVFFISIPARAQVTESGTATTEQQLEQITANNEDLEAEDDSYLQQMLQFVKDPVNLNTADAGRLKELCILTDVQIRNFILYRDLFGKLVDLYELQAVPGWDIYTIQKIRPYISVSIAVGMNAGFKSRLSNGDHSMLIRGSMLLERSKGYIKDSASANDFYQGSPQKLLFRYKYIYKNLLQYGITAEKDAGEQFFKGKQKSGFDFYSAHIFARKMGVIKSLAIGDFTVNLGQGLIQWQSLAFKKTVDVINIKREADILRPYNSAGETNFHRGAGITLGKHNWEITLFGSYKNIDANLVADTAQNHNDFVSSLQTSGYHRTKGETADKGIQKQLAFGGNLSYHYRKLHLGMNTVRYTFKLPLIKSVEPYNKYALSGSAFGNYSLDYSYTYKNLHVFGEAAFSSGFDKAFINGLMISPSSSVDLALLYRNISRSYQSLYTAAFTENTYPTNEKGVYAAVSIRPGNSWRIDAFADFYKFPWLRYRVNAPSTGADYLVQVNFKPNKRLEMYSRYHAETKAINVKAQQFTLSPIVRQPKKSCRTQVIYKVNTAITLQTRVDLMWFDTTSISSERGILTYFDFIYIPLLKPYSINARLQYFETDSYNSRLYAYENDVLYSFSVPVFYDKGVRYYININYDLYKKLSLWLKWSQTVLQDKNLIGSGLDEIIGRKKSEVKLQLLYKF